MGLQGRKCVPRAIFPSGLWGSTVVRARSEPGWQSAHRSGRAAHPGRTGEADVDLWRAVENVY